MTRNDYSFDSPLPIDLAAVTRKLGTPLKATTCSRGYCPFCPGDNCKAVIVDGEWLCAYRGRVGSADDYLEALIKANNPRPYQKARSNGDSGGCCRTVRSVTAGEPHRPRPVATDRESPQSGVRLASSTEAA